MPSRYTKLIATFFQARNIIIFLFDTFKSVLTSYKSISCQFLSHHAGLKELRQKASIFKQK